jgi:hypothetical protein
LPPGVYDLKAEFRGFKTLVVEGIHVQLDRSSAVNLKMEVAPVTDVVDVIGAPPAIDLTTNTTGITASADLFTRIPMERTFFAIARLAPGTLEDETGTAFHGSSGLENQYVIDGLNVTGTYNGGRGKDLNFDFVEEVEVKTGGLPAEYGRTTGGILNVLTKSGGNDFHGSIFGFFAGAGLQSNDRTAPERPADTTTTENTSARWDVGAEIGGRLVRDRLWFFGAYNRVAEDTVVAVVRELEGEGVPAIGSEIPRGQRDNRFAGKLSWRPADSSTVTLSVFGDPNHATGPVRDINGPPGTYLGFADAGGTDSTLRYQGVFGSSLLVQALYGRHRESLTLGGPGTSTPRVDDLTVVPTASTGGIGGYSEQTRHRDVYKLDVSKGVGGHELKIGGDFEDLLGTERLFVSGGDRVAKLTTRGRDYYQHFFFLDDRASGFDPDEPSTWRLANPSTSSPRTRNVSAYVQDTWKIRNAVTVGLGLRYERQSLEDREGNTPLVVDNWAPRVGFGWDLHRDGRSKLYASFGRYFESIPQVIQLRAFGGAAAVFSFNFDPSPGAVAPDARAPQAPLFWFGGKATPVAPGIGGQHMDEWFLGFERELRSDLAFGVNGGFRRIGRIIEDLTTADGEYLFGNPGEGPASTLGFMDGTLPAAPSPRPKRPNYSLEVTARKHFSGGWQLLGSYVFTQLRGNYEGTYQRSTGGSSPNWDEAFDTADFLVNADGPLTSESVHQFKLDASYELTRKAAGLNVGLSTHWYSGLPENAYGLSLSYLEWVYFLVPRGKVGRNPADFEISLHASYPMRLGKKAQVRIQADVFNILNRQAVISYDQRYNQVADGPCGGVPDGFCTTDGGLATRPGTLEPLVVITDPRQTATNPDYLRKGNLFTGQRSLRLGLRLSF